MMHTMSKAFLLSATLLKTAGALLYLFTLGLFHKPHRELTKEMAGLIDAFLFPKPSIPSVAITDLVPCQVTVKLCAQEKHLGNIGLDELLVIVELIQSYQPLVCFEIGTFDGRTTLNMAANTSEEAVIYTLDLPRAEMRHTAFPLDPSDLDVVDKDTSGIRFHSTEWKRKIRQLYGDSATFDYRPYIGKIDFVFVDGSHTYQYALSDSQIALQLLRDGKGVILWHDYTTWPGVHKAINALSATDPRFADVRFIEHTSFACLICK